MKIPSSSVYQAVSGYSRIFLFFVITIEKWEFSTTMLKYFNKSSWHQHHSKPLNVWNFSIDLLLPPPAYDMNGKIGILGLLYFKTYSSTFFLCFSVQNFETLFFLLQVRMRFKGLHNESYSNFCFLEIHQWWKL